VDSIKGIGGITLFVGIIIAALRAAQLIDARFAPLVSLILGAALGILWQKFGWIPAVTAQDPWKEYGAAAVIGLWAGASAAGLTNTAQEITKPA
jgi:hypothetical protein